ncbi:MAG: four helix bundle suffix domain-containing protein [Kiritimatiellaeota bacterium]|nr:four helix bundle suffix domain-containing protein [Kiritimatiellota bacterium]
MATPLFSKRGGYRKLDSFMLATIIYYTTVEFCRAHIKSGRQQEQMIQAARSGRQNIAEGSERSSTSMETEIKLTDVARASLAELQLDYEDFINLGGGLPWPDDAPECQNLRDIRLTRPDPEADMIRGFAQAVAENRKRFAQWINPDDPIATANALIRLCDRADWLLRCQLDALGKRFLEEGGFREKMTRARIEARDEADTTPDCPLCGKKMVRRTVKNGPHSGDAFWGCSGYPECKGTKRINSDQAEPTR